MHDYQLMLVPGMLRQKFPDLSIGFFLHIPFPSYELFRSLPWRKEILDGILGVPFAPKCLLLLDDSVGRLQNTCWIPIPAQTIPQAQTLKVLEQYTGMGCTMRSLDSILWGIYSEQDPDTAILQMFHVIRREGDGHCSVANCQSMEGENRRKADCRRPSN